MEQVSDNEFFQLLDTIVKEQKINVPTTSKETYTFGALTTNQLKEIIQTLVDKSLSNVSFNTAVYNIIKENLIVGDLTDKPLKEFNSLDAILFLLTARIQVISDKVYMLSDDEEGAIEVNLNSIVDNILKFVESSTSEKLHEYTVELENIKTTLGIPFLKTEIEINKELYKGVDLTSETKSSEVENFIGNAFIVEIAKWIKNIQINDRVLDFTILPYNAKVKVVEGLPAALIEKVLQYIEQTKNDIRSCLTVSNKVLPVNGSLFSIR